MSALFAFLFHFWWPVFVVLAIGFSFWCVIHAGARPMDWDNHSRHYRSRQEADRLMRNLRHVTRADELPETYGDTDEYERAARYAVEMRDDEMRRKLRREQHDAGWQYHSW